MNWMEIVLVIALVLLIYQEWRVHAWQKLAEGFRANADEAIAQTQSALKLNAQLIEQMGRRRRH